MQKRGQVTLFVIVGIVIVIILGLLFVLLRPGIEAPPVTEETGDIENYLQECAENIVIDGKTDYRFPRQGTTEQSLSWLAEYTKERFEQECADLSLFPGARALTTNAKVDVNIDGPTLNDFERLLVTIKYPVEYVRGGTTQQLPSIVIEVLENQ